MKALRHILIGILVVLLLLSATSVVRRIAFNDPVPLTFGYGSAVIVGGSMEPAIDFGDMVLIRRQGAYELGDVVTFKPESGRSVVTHRVVEVTSSGYITQGDANNARDPEVTPDQMIGRVVRTIPGVGKIILFFQRPLGVAILAIGLFAIIEGPSILKRQRHQNSPSMGRGYC